MNEKLVYEQFIKHVGEYLKHAGELLRMLVSEEYRDVEVVSSMTEASQFLESVLDLTVLAKQAEEWTLDAEIVKLLDAYVARLTTKSFREAVMNGLGGWLLHTALEFRLPNYETLVAIAKPLHGAVSILLSSFDQLYTKRKLNIGKETIEFRFTEAEPDDELRVLFEAPILSGIAECLAEEHARDVARLFPQSLIPSHWYSQHAEDGLAYFHSVENDTLEYGTYVSEYPALDQYQIYRLPTWTDVEFIELQEFEGWGQGDEYRCLAAAIHYKGVPGTDFYAIMLTTYATLSHLFVGGSQASESEKARIKGLIFWSLRELHKDKAKLAN